MFKKGLWAQNFPGMCSLVWGREYQYWPDGAVKVWEGLFPEALCGGPFSPTTMTMEIINFSAVFSLPFP